LGAAACGPKEIVRPTEARFLVATRGADVDTAPKEDLRMVPPEAYMRTYLALFGGLLPLEAQARARGAQGGQVFDTWDDYFSALGFPDYHLDLPRGAQTNALMMATFERLGVALCDRAVEHDLGGEELVVPKVPPPPPRGMGKNGDGKVAERKRDRADRPEAMGAMAGPKAPEADLPPPLPGGLAASAPKLIFTFGLPKGPLDAGAFAQRFDILHRRFLGYPAELAPTDRTARFFALYNQIAQRHAGANGKGKRFTPAEAGWAAVCYGLVRHPEFQLY
jgi:hypothetical protein